MIIATVIFGFSLFLIVTLFLLKHWELKSTRVLAPGARARIDSLARRCKQLLEEGESKLQMLPPMTVRVLRKSLAFGAVSFASIAQQLAHQAHRLADLVSHKHNFVQRETKSTFLKQMSDHKNGSKIPSGNDITPRV